MRSLSALFISISLLSSTVLGLDDTGNGAAQVTMAYMAALQPHAVAEGGAGAPCPTFIADSKTLKYVLASNKAGCCAPTASAAIVGLKAVACCPEGAHCTGFFPKMLDWTATAGKFAIASPTPTKLITSAIATNAAEATGN